MGIQKPEVKRLDGATIVDVSLGTLDDLQCPIKWLVQIAEECQLFTADAARRLGEKQRYTHLIDSSGTEYDCRYILSFANVVVPGNKLKIKVQGEDKLAEHLAVQIYSLLTTYDLDLDGFIKLISPQDVKWVTNQFPSRREEEVLDQIPRVLTRLRCNHDKLIRTLFNPKKEDLADLAEMIECAFIQIPNYKIIRKLGAGADGLVYEAESKIFGKVKVKIFKDPEDKIKDAVEREGVSLEERIQRRVRLFDKKVRDKTHFTQLYEVGECNNPLNGKKTVYLTLDYIPGGAAEVKDSHGNYIIREDIEDRVFEVFFKILDGFEKLHNAGLVLRDVKLRNILVSYTEAVLIDDLETIADVRDVAFGERLTEGSDRYAAPEVMDDVTNANFCSDIYSLGVCLLYMLTRKPTLMTAINEIKNADEYHEQLESMLKKETNLGYRERRFFHRALAFYHHTAYPPEPEGYKFTPPEGYKFVRFRHVGELKEHFIKTFTPTFLGRLSDLFYSLIKR